MALDIKTGERHAGTLLFALRGRVGAPPHGTARGPLASHVHELAVLQEEEARQRLRDQVADHPGAGQRRDEAPPALRAARCRPTRGLRADARSPQRALVEAALVLRLSRRASQPLN